MPARDAAVGLLLLVLADVGLSPEEILVAEGYPHFQATATLLLRDDFELPIERIVQLLDSYAKVSRHIFICRMWTRCQHRKTTSTLLH